MSKVSDQDSQSPPTAEDYNVLMTSQTVNSALEFWRTRLSRVSDTFRLASGARLDAGAPFESLTVQLSPDAMRVLAGIGGSELGEFTITTAAIALALARYSQRTTVVIRTPPLKTSEIDVNPSVPLIIDVDGRLNVAEYLEEVVRIVEESYSETRLPLRELVNREGSVTFDDLTTIALADARVHSPLNGDESSEVYFDLRLDEGIINLHWRLPEAFLAEGLAASLSGVIEQLEQLDVAVRDIDIVTPGERHRLLIEFNKTAVQGTDGFTVVDLFESQVQKSPEAPALVFQERLITYSELNDWANCLAHYLRKQYGARPEMGIGVRLDRSEWMIIAILGILKAGAHFVPIDPQHPIERVNFILQETGLALLITQSDYVFEDLEFSGNIVALDIEFAGLPVQTENPCTVIDPATAAYVIYTSGSTGNPKGCVLEHQNLSNYLSWAINYYFEDDSCGNFGLYSSLSFDFTITNIFCPLVRGKALRIYPQSDSIQTILTHAFNADSGVDVMKLTPSHIRLLEHLSVRDCGIRKVIAGGEELTTREVDILRAMNPAIEIYNEYGPTEATVGCIVKKLGPGGEPVTIGRPIANMSIYVLDEDLKLAPVGVKGEICISGRGLARGYRDPAQTAAKFCPHPFLDGERLYRTGDIDRWLPVGELEYFGRNDDQIKIRGYRVELGEVESVLASHPDVTAAIVLLREDTNGNKRLAGYLIASPQITAEAMRQFAAGKLPDYMVPTEYGFLSEFPLNVNGKVDRRALSDLQIGRRAPIDLTVDIQRKLAQETILGRDHILRQLTGCVLAHRLGCYLRTGNEITCQSLIAVCVFAKQDDGRGYVWVTGQHRFDFAQFDSITPNLDLVIVAAEIFKFSDRQPAANIAGPIQTFAFQKRMWVELRRRLCWITIAASKSPPRNAY